MVEENKRMTIIQATSGTYRSRVDGTLVISIEVEPRHAQAALALIGMPGTPLAIARLVSDHEIKGTIRPPNTEIGKWESIGPLCVLAIQLCKDERFWDYLNYSIGVNYVDSENKARMFILHDLDIDSRKELDGDKEIEYKFHETFRKPYMAWLEKGGK